MTRLLSVLLAAATLAGCQSLVPESPILPTIQPVTRTSFSLRNLPPPSEPIVVAVYENDDLTGQYKERDNIQSLSRAVTQGGAPLLIQALQEAGERSWFTVLERAELDNLLKERQIITEMRRVYRNEQNIDAHALPPLLSASIIMEGAIVGYDTNTVTGGVGARFLGIGGDTKYQHDTVTVALRAVSTKTGEVLASVTTAKSVASVAVQGGAFRFVKLDELFEAEAGVTVNEPRYIAVQQAVEWAVTSLIIEGAELNAWHFADPAEQARLIAAYREDKYGNREVLTAQARPGVRTANPASVTQTVPRRPRRVARATPRVTQTTRPLPAGARPVQQAVPVRVVNPTVVTVPSQQTAPTAPPSGSAGAAPAGSIAPERTVPPAPSVDEPALGSLPDEKDRPVRTARL